VPKMPIVPKIKSNGSNQNRFVREPNFLEFWSFGFVSNFGFRASNLKKPLNREPDNLEPISFFNR
jgi:hypothetical protein